MPQDWLPRNLTLRVEGFVGNALEVVLGPDAPWNQIRVPDQSLSGDALSQNPAFKAARLALGTVYYTPPLASRIWAQTAVRSRAIVSQDPQVRTAQFWAHSLDLASSVKDSKDYPKVSFLDYQKFTSRASYLYSDGQELIVWADRASQSVQSNARIDSNEQARLGQGVSLVRTLANTAAITAAPQLWAVYEILSCFQELGINDQLRGERAINVLQTARDLNLDPDLLEAAFSALVRLKLLDRLPSGSVRAKDSALFESFPAIPKEFRRDMATEMIDWLKGELHLERDVDGKRTGKERPELVEERVSRIQAWFAYRMASAYSERARNLSKGDAWTAGPWELQLSYYLCPILLALYRSGKAEEVKAGDLAEGLDSNILSILYEASFVENGRWTELAARTFGNGRGTFGILYAYNTFFRGDLADFLSGNKRHVNRADNIIGSRDAHTRVFGAMAKNLVKYLQDSSAFNRKSEKRPLLIEHAVASAQGLQAVFAAAKKAGVGDITGYFRPAGFDLEDDALNTGIRTEIGKNLPEDTIVGKADIGKPEQMFAELENAGYAREDLAGSILIVSAGLHEIRDARGGRASDDDVVRALTAYRKAGIILFMDETTDFTEDQMRMAAWQSYHPIFQLFHTWSGQGLRTMEKWMELLDRAGYVVDSTYTVKGRPLMPVHDLPESKNPPINVSYFAIPKQLVKQPPKPNGTANITHIHAAATSVASSPRDPAPAARMRRYRSHHAAIAMRRRAHTRVRAAHLAHRRTQRFAARANVALMHTMAARSTALRSLSVVRR